MKERRAMMLCIILYVAPKAFKVRWGPWGSGLDIFKKRHIIFTQDLQQWKVPFLSCLIRHKEILAPKKWGLLIGGNRPGQGGWDRECRWVLMSWPCLFSPSSGMEWSHQIPERIKARCVSPGRGMASKIDFLCFASCITTDLYHSPFARHTEHIPAPLLFR